MVDICTFELLAVDHQGNASCDDASGLLYALRGFSQLWDSPTIDESNSQINDGSTSLAVAEVQQPALTDDIDDPLFGRAYHVGLSGEFDEVEPLRQPLTAYLKERQQFDPLYVVRDDVSREIACQLYPLLYKVENRLRGYLIKFMTIQLGPGWWKQTASREVDDKVKKRRRNEQIFGRHVDNFTYLTDFGELGAMIYEQSSGFLTRDDIVAKIRALPETVDAVKGLKEELQTNYQKFFRESFADRSFKEKWADFEWLRNKIAHSNLFTAEDLSSGKQLFADLIDIVDKADQKTSTLVITSQEREALQETVSERGAGRHPITEEEFLYELKQQEDHFSARNGFVGITQFIRRHLVNQDFDPYSAQRMLEQLEEQGEVEIYQVPNPRDNQYKTSAIRIPHNIV